MSLGYGEQESLGQAMFGNAEFGDLRRTARAVKTFDALRRHPGGTLPDKLASPSALKALYRLCDCPQVTHEALLDSLRAYTLRHISANQDVVLLIHDATELDYSSRKSLAGQLGQIGQGHGKGFICHQVLAVDASSRGVLGLFDQILHRRVKVPKNESPKTRRERQSRESLLWITGTRHLPVGRRFVDVADQGADSFEFLEHETRSGRTFVIRVHHARKVQSGHDGTSPKQTLPECASELPELGRFTMSVQPQKGRPGRKDATFVVHAGPVLVHPPHFRAGNHGDQPLPLYLVRVRELDPPQGAKPVEWLLLTNEPVTTFEDAWRVISWYESRWVVEEYHKAQKTGCQIEGLQFTDVERLEPAIAMLSAVALTLLDLRDASRRSDAKTRRATQLIDRDYVEVLTVWRYGKVRLDITVHEFHLALARLGGHQNRRHDHPPGWLVLWRGWTKLQAMLDGYQARQRQKCG